MTHTYRFAAVLALGLLAVAGCSSPSGDAPKAGKTGEVVATVGNDVITVDDFNAKLDEQSPFIRARYNTLERKKEFLDNLIRFEVLAQEAKRRGLDKDPEVQATLEKVMVQRLIRAEFDESTAGKDLPEEDLKKYYDEHIEDYVKPERVRVSHIFFAAPADPAGRSKVKSHAARVLAEVKGKEAGTDKTAFVNTARELSEDAASKAAGGDLSFKTREELSALWGAKFANAAFGLDSIGQIADLVEGDKGFHLVKLTGRQNALDRPFEQVKAQIQNRLSRDKRTKAFDDFVAGLRLQANVKVNEDVLDAIEVRPAGDDPKPPPTLNLPAGTPPSAVAPHPAGAPVKLDLKAPVKPGVKALPVPAPEQK
jgi:peptidyl-prolyl cis-trans isomerase C